MSTVGGWKRFMTNCIQHTVNLVLVVLVNPNVAVIQEIGTVFRLQRIWRQVSFFLYHGGGFCFSICYAVKDMLA